MPEVVAQLAYKAMQMPAAQNNFKTKHLNVWVNADVAWMDMRAWDKCADSALKVEQFAGEPCTVGIDLASKIDLTPMMRVFTRMLKNEG
jgi:phage terminase large subunit-like protein